MGLCGVARGAPGPRAGAEPVCVLNCLCSLTHLSHQLSHPPLSPTLAHLSRPPPSPTSFTHLFCPHPSPTSLTHLFHSPLFLTSFTLLFRPPLSPTSFNYLFQSRISQRPSPPSFAHLVRPPLSRTVSMRFPVAVCGPGPLPTALLSLHSPVIIRDVGASVRAIPSPVPLSPSPPHPPASPPVVTQNTHHHHPA